MQSFAGTVQPNKPPELSTVLKAQKYQVAPSYGQYMFIIF